MLGLKRAIAAPRPAEVPLAEGEEPAQGALFDEPGEGATPAEDAAPTEGATPAEDETPGAAAPSTKDDETRSE